MEDDNGLDLSLSLPCGGPSTKSKNDSGLDARIGEDDRGSKLIDDFKNFLDGGTHKEETIVGSQKGDQSKPMENLFYDLSQATANVDASSNINSGGFWRNNDNRSTEIQEERRQEAGSKRKNLFDDMNHQKRHEREAHLADMHVKGRTSHVSIDEGSMAENEDVADSEAEGSTSKLVPHRDDASKRRNGNVGLSEGSKEVHGVPDSSGVDLQGQSGFTISSKSEFKPGHVSYGVPFSGQAANILNMPYPLSTKESNPNTVSANKSEGLVSHSLQFQPSYFGRGPPNSNNQNDGLKITQGNALKPFERLKGDGKQAKEEGSSLHIEGDVKGINGIGASKSAGDQARADGCPPEYPAIKPGIAAELKFGGSGSSPNLPWVSTTGPGPNGKTISGVTYRYSGTQIRIVCACHGSHMSPEEFIQHASEEQPNPNGGGPGLASVPNSNPAASAQN